MYSISFELSTPNVHHSRVFLDSKNSGHIFLLVVLLSLSEVISYLKIISLWLRVSGALNGIAYK